MRAAGKSPAANNGRAVVGVKGRGIAAKGRGGSNPPFVPTLDLISVVSECLNRRSSGLGLDLKDVVIARI